MDGKEYPFGRFNPLTPFIEEPQAAGRSRAIKLSISRLIFWAAWPPELGDLRRFDDDISIHLGAAFPVMQQ